MNKAKRERLEASGWKVGTVAEFLELTPEESALIEIKLALSRRLGIVSSYSSLGSSDSSTGKIIRSYTSVRCRTQPMESRRRLSSRLFTKE